MRPRCSNSAANDLASRLSASKGQGWQEPSCRLIDESDRNVEKKWARWLDLIHHRAFLREENLKNWLITCCGLRRGCPRSHHLRGYHRLYRHPGSRRHRLHSGSLRLRLGGVAHYIRHPRVGGDSPVAQERVHER